MTKKSYSFEEVDASRLLGSLTALCKKGRLKPFFAEITTIVVLQNLQLGLPQCQDSYDDMAKNPRGRFLSKMTNLPSCRVSHIYISNSNGSRTFFISLVKILGRKDRKKEKNEGIKNPFLIGRQRRKRSSWRAAESGGNNSLLSELREDYPRKMDVN